MKSTSRNVAGISLALVVLLVSTVLIFKTTQPGHAGQVLLDASDYSLPSGADPWGTTFDSAGNVWVAAPGCDPSPTCNKNTPPGLIEEWSASTATWLYTYLLPAGYAQALFLAFDAKGNLWFPLPMSNALGMYNPQHNTFHKWTVPTPASGPWDLAIDQTGNIWFTEHYSNKIGRFDPVAHTFMEVATTASNSQPYGITVDTKNNIWFTENNSAVALIGEYTAKGKLLQYKIRNSNSGALTPHLITVDPGGNVWWSEGFVGEIGKLDVTHAVPGTNRGVTEYKYKQICASCGGAHTSGIGFDSYGNIWFDDSLQSIYGSFPESGSGSFSLFTTPTQNSHPHDGLNVDGHDSIWFDEEFANKLAQAVQQITPTPTASPSMTDTPTSTDTPTPTDTPMSTPTPSPAVTLGQDSFQRMNQIYWGMASDGQMWAGAANKTSSFSIVGNVGQVTANASTNYSAILGPSATNAEVLYSGSLSSLSNTNVGAVLRWTNGNNWYKAAITGTRLIIQKDVGGVLQILTKVPFVATPGTSYTLRFQVFGSTLSAKVWQTGNTEPSKWMVSTTDGSLAAGYCGLRLLLQSGTTATFTSFQAMGF